MYRLRSPVQSIRNTAGLSAPRQSYHFGAHIFSKQENYPINVMSRTFYQQGVPISEFKRLKDSSVFGSSVDMIGMV